MAIYGHFRSFWAIAQISTYTFKKPSNMLSINPSYIHFRWKPKSDESVWEILLPEEGETGRHFAC